MPQSELSFRLYIKQDAKTIKEKLNLAKRINSEGEVINTKYFGCILEECRDKQLESILDPDGDYVEFLYDIQDKFDLDIEKDSHKYFVLYKFIEENFLAFPKTVTTKNRLDPNDNFLGHAISNIKAKRHTKRSQPFIAWLWRDHEDEAKKLYDLLGLKQYRIYDHQEIQDYINNPSPADEAEGTQVNAAPSTTPIHLQPQPIHIAPVTQQRPTMRFAYKGIREDDDNPFHAVNMPFFGRESELKRLDDFIKSKHDVALWAVSGSSGTGKTRLIQHWMIHSEAMPAERWDQWVLGTEFTPFDGKDYDSWEPDYPILIVIDYLHVHQQALESILERCKILNRRGILKHKPVRIMLIDHVFPENLSSLAGNPRYGMKNIDTNDFGDCPYIFDTPLKLAVKTSLDADNKETVTDAELDKIIPLILKESAGKYISLDIQKKAISYLKKLPSGYYPLFAILIGYTLKKAQERGEDLCFETWSRRQLIAEYFKRHKRLPWTEEYGEEGKWAAACVAVATVRRGMSWDLLQQHIPCHEVDFPTVQTISRQIVSADGDSDILNQYEPDIMGETFFLMFIQDLKKGGKDLYDIEKALFMMIPSGSDALLYTDKEEFIGFFTRLSRNLCNDNQEDLSVKNHWETLFWFLNNHKYKESSITTWCVHASTVEIINEIVAAIYRENKNSFYLINNLSVFIDIMDLDVLHKQIYPDYVFFINILMSSLIYIECLLKTVKIRNASFPDNEWKKMNLLFDFPTNRF